MKPSRKVVALASSGQFNAPDQWQAIDQILDNLRDDIGQKKVYSGVETDSWRLTCCRWMLSVKPVGQRSVPTLSYFLPSQLTSATPAEEKAEASGRMDPLGFRRSTPTAVTLPSTLLLLAHDGSSPTPAAPGFQPTATKPVTIGPARTSSQPPPPSQGLLSMVIFRMQRVLLFLQNGTPIQLSV